jgi:hypothetical protein
MGRNIFIKTKKIKAAKEKSLTAFKSSSERELNLPSNGL